MITQILLIIVVIASIVWIVGKKYFLSKIEETINKTPNPNKPLAHLPEWKKALILIPLVVIFAFFSHLSIKNVNIRYDIRNERQQQSIERKYIAGNPADSVFSYEFFDNQLRFRHEVILVAPPIPEGFCFDMKNALWSVVSVSSDGHYLSAKASCVTIYSEGEINPDDKNYNRRLLIVDLKEKKVVFDSKITPLPYKEYMFGEFVGNSKITTYIYDKNNPPKQLLYSLENGTLE
jgi:hypothetical protein